MRIALEVRRTLDLEASTARRQLFLFRLWARVRFRHSTGWTEPHPAIIDTGAPYAVIPASLWPMLRLQRICDLPLRGIVPGKAAELEATLAKVSGQLLDAIHVSPRFPLWAMLAKTDQVPLILGWSGVLERAKLNLDARRNRAWLEL